MTVESQEEEYSEMDGYHLGYHVKFIILKLEYASWSAMVC